MKQKIIEFLQWIRGNSAKIGSYDEATTKQGIVLRLLDLLGWDTFDTEEVIPEYSIEGKRVDLCLAVERANEVFVEVKRPSEDVERHEKQLLDYAFHQGIDLAILTNGLLYWFYLPTAKGPWKKRRFYTIDVLEQDPHEVASKLTDILCKSNVASGISIKECRRIHESRLKKDMVSETLPEAWNKIISEPDSLLVDLLSETTERLCGYKPEDTMVKKYLLKHKSELQIDVPQIGPPEQLPKTEMGTTHKQAKIDPSRRQVEIVLKPIHSPRTYAFIPLPKEIRSFFPGYKVPFFLETDIGEIETRVTSAPKGTQIGNPEGGSSIQGGLRPWYDKHGSLKEGSVLVIQVVEQGKRYRLGLK